MCYPASFVLTKKACFWSLKSDRHEDIIAENELVEKSAAGDILIVRCEVKPDDGDLSTPSEEWRYHLDQDLVPVWYDAAEAERRCRACLPEWITAKLLLSGHRTIRDQQIYMYDSSRAELRGSSRAELYDSSQAVLYDSSQAELYDSSRAELWGSSRAELYDSSRAELWDSSTAFTYWSTSTVVLHGPLAVHIHRKGGAATCTVGKGE